MMDIVTRVGQSATPVVLEQVAKLLGVTERTVETGLAAAAPAVLAGLLAMSRRPGTAGRLAAILPDADGLAALLAGHPAAAASRGQALVASLLGEEATAALAAAVAARAGTDAAAGAALLGLGGAMAFGALGQEAAANGLDAGGVLGLIERNRTVISAALPADLAAAVGSGGRAARPVRPPIGAPMPLPPPVRRTRGLAGWLAAAAALLLLAGVVGWLLASGPAVQAPTAALGSSADALVVDGVDIGARVGTALEEITAAFAGISDVASAQVELARLDAARDRLSGLETPIAGLSEQGRAALKQMVTAALPTIRSDAARLKTDGPIAAVVGPAIDDILARLTAFAA